MSATNESMKIARATSIVRLIVLCVVDDELPELVSSANGSCGAADDDSDEENWNEDDMETEPINCLFCLSIFFSYDVAIAHIKKDHNVDLMDLKYRFNMNQYSYIKV